jgi:hypothetical protein
MTLQAKILISRVLTIKILKTNEIGSLYTFACGVSDLFKV